MTNSMMSKLLNQLGLGPRHARQRITRGATLCHLSAESLEERALLSATSLAESSAAEIHHSRKDQTGFAYPEVNGPWTLVINGEDTGDTISITRKKTKVTTTLTLPGVGEITSKDKFSPEHQLDYSGVIKAKDPELGKVTINLTIQFPEDLNQPNPLRPTKLTGEATVTGGSITEPIVYEITGDQVVANPGAQSLAHAAKAVTYPDVGGTWSLIVSGPAGDLPGDLLVSQDPPEGRKFSASFNIALGSLDLKGKIDPKDTTHASGKALLEITGSPKVRMKFNLTYANDFTTLTGTATAKKFPTVTFTGTRQEA